MAEFVRGDVMYRILKKYMSEYFPFKYYEKDKVFSFYQYIQIFIRKQDIYLSVKQVYIFSPLDFAKL